MTTFPTPPLDVPKHYARACERAMARFSDDHGPIASVEWRDVPEGKALVAEICGKTAAIGVAAEDLRVHPT